MAVFRAKVDGEWQPYCNDACGILQQAYEAGFPSVRFSVKGIAYKFDFKRKQQKNLVTGEIWEMEAPSSLKQRSSDLFSRREPVFVVKVPEGAAGKNIQVAHPKKLGKFLKVAVPIGTPAGQNMFVPVPSAFRNTTLLSFYAVGATGSAGVVGASVALGTHCLIAAGWAGTVASVVSVGGPIVIGAAVAIGVVGAGALAVHTAVKNPAKARKAIAAGVVGGLGLGGLAVAAAVAEDGVGEIVGGLAEGLLDVGDGVGDAVDAIGDFVEADDLLEGAGDVGDGVGDAVDAIGDFVEADDLLEGAGELLEDGVDLVGDVLEDLILDLF